MPNWVINKITFEGADNENVLTRIKELQEFIRGTGIPEESDSGVEPELLAIDFHKLIPFPEDEQDWYNWCINHWGTKWNASDSMWVEDNILFFQTAWAAPHPVIAAMAAKFPDLEFTHQWADEDYGNNCGEAYYSEGVGSPVDPGMDATQFARALWGDEDEDDDDDFDWLYDNWEPNDEDDDEDEDEGIEPVTVDSGLSISDLI